MLKRARERKTTFLEYAATWSLGVEQIGGACDSGKSEGKQTVEEKG